MEIHGSLYYQPKQCIIIVEEISKITIYMYMVLFPKHG